MNLIVVEKNRLIRARLEILLKGEGITGTVQTFLTAERAVEKADWINAHLLITGIRLGSMDGIALLEWVRDNHPHLCSMVFTRYDDRMTVLAAVRAGACGYLLEDCPPRRIIEAVHEIIEGGAPMTPRVARMVVSSLQQPSPRDNPLSSREKEILLYIDQGLTYKEIASALSISPNTVHTHVKHVNEKLNADSRETALFEARRLGWI